MKRPQHFQFAIDQAVKYGFVPKCPNEYLGVYAFFMQTTYGFPIELTQEHILKDLERWMKRATLDLLCLYYVLYSRQSNSKTMATALSTSQQLTHKQQKWLELYISGETATEAAMQAYDCKDRDSASQIGYENLRKLDFSDLMEGSGLTDSFLNLKLMQGLESSKQIGARKIVQGARTGHEIKVDSTTGEDDFIEVPDMAVRHKYLETALKMKGKLIDRKDITTDGEKLEAVEVVIIEDKTMAEQ